MTTVNDIYAAINPLPALLSEKGKENPVVQVGIEANANITISLRWKKYGSVSDWDMDYNYFVGDNFEQSLAKAVAFIHKLPPAEQARLHAFMDKLGKLIDVGKSEGIEVEYLNPLLDTMKRLSENVITYKPA